MEWSEELHTKFISKQTSNGSKEISDDTMRNLDGTLTQLRSDIKAGRKTSSKENLNISKLSNAQRKMILKMTSIDRIRPTDDFMESMKDFMDQTTSAMAYEHLQGRLRGRKVTNRNPVFGNIFSCQKAHFISREEGVPGCLAVFAFPQSSNFYSSGELGCIHMQSEFNNISEEKSTFLSKHKIFTPENVNGSKHMLNAFAVICAELFGDKSMGVLELWKMLEFVNKNKNAFKEWQCNDPAFMTQWLYIIDCRWQRFAVKVKDERSIYQSCATGDSAMILTAECSEGNSTKSFLTLSVIEQKGKEIRMEETCRKEMITNIRKGKETLFKTQELTQPSYSRKISITVLCCILACTRAR